jgi:prefoldin subunit 5
MASESTTRWPLLEERTPYAAATARPEGRKLPRSAWLFTGLAFLCGGLVSAAGFSIGWRHQAQRNTAAQTALAAATARANRLEQRTSALRTSLASARRAEARERAAATAASRALAAGGARVAAAAAASGNAAGSVSSGAGSLTASSARIAGELKTLDTYLTTTPAGQLDPGYIASQTSYLGQQLAKLQANAGDLDGSVASFEAALRKLGRDASALKSR